MVTTMLPVLGILLSLPDMDVLEHFWLTRININWELLDFVDTGDINHQVLNLSWGHTSLRMTLGSHLSPRTHPGYGLLCSVSS